MRRKKCLQIRIIRQKPGNLQIRKLKCQLQTLCHPLKKLNRKTKDSTGVGHFNQQWNSIIRKCQGILTSMLQMETD